MSTTSEAAMQRSSAADDGTVDIAATLQSTASSTARRAFDTVNYESTVNPTAFLPNLPHSRESSTLSDPRESDRAGLEVNSSSKHNLDRALAEKNEEDQLSRKKRRMDPEKDVHIGYHADFPDVPMFGQLNAADVPIVRVRMDKSPGWTTEQWKSNFSPNGLVSIEKVAFLEEIAKKYNGDIQTAHNDQKRKLLRKHLNEHIEGTLMPSLAASGSISKVIKEIQVGRHIQLGIPVFAFLKSHVLLFRVHNNETAVKFEEIQFAKAYDLGAIEATKKKLKTLLSHPKHSETNPVPTPCPNPPRLSAVLSHENDNVVTDAKKVFEKSFIALQTAFAQQSQNLASFREQITTHEDELAEREKVLLQKENFQTRAKNTIGSLQRLEPDLNYRNEIQKYREEKWVKDRNDYFKAREQDLIEREENLKQREADVAKRELKVNSNVDKGQVVSSVPAPLPYPAAILGSLDIPQGLTFKDAFGKLKSSNPNGGMFWERNSRVKVLTDAPLNGISFNETRMLIDLCIPRIEVDGQPTNQKFVTKEGETYSIYSKDGVRKLVKDLDQGSFVEYQGKWYICRTLLKEQVEDETF